MNNTIDISDKKDQVLKIIAIGNDLYGDDGVGLAVLETLASIPNIENVELVNGATDALGLIDHFIDVEHVIIIDAAQMGEQPGTVKVFDREDIKMTIKVDNLSVHGISLAETFEIAEAIDSLPGKITIIGIEPKNIGISQNLSDLVAQSIPEVVTNIINLIHK
ncbi:MAG: hydrogenase maturation protease [Planctomycetia bacterium]|nr:hydrogenase maturation protease [Planctomycetia bacterium]